MSLPTIDFPNPDLPVRDVDVSSARASGPRPPRAIGDTGFSAEVVFESRPPAGRMRPATAAADGKDQTEPEPTKTTRRPGNDAGDGPTETAEGEPQSPAQGTGRGTPAAKVVMDGLSLRVTIAKESAEPNPEGAETSAQRKAGPGRGRPTVEKRPERSRPATPLRKLPTREPLDETQTSKTQAIHKSIPYLSLPVSPAAAAAMRAVRDHDRRITREDAGQQVARDHRFVRAAEMAFARYERAVDKGFTMARYNLARALAEGRGTERDPARAARNFGMVAVTGNVPAMLRLADLHLAGVGVKKDRIEALALYIVAASIGSKGAERAKTMLSAHLGLDRVEQARERAKKLREQMPPLDLIQQQEKEQELLEAAAEGDEERIEDLLRQGVDANAVDAIGRTAIINAAWRGHEHIVRMLVEAGVEIDAADDQDRTPLAWASINGYGEISRDLLAEAALVDVRDRDGLTPLIRAAWNGHVEIVDALVKNEADVHAADDRGMTALDRARAQNERAIINVLRTAGARY
jgi:hypothetical protein